jgi:hypothetical protein
VKDAMKSKWNFDANGGGNARHKYVLQTKSVTPMHLNELRINRYGNAVVKRISCDDDMASIPDESIRFINSHNPSGRTMATESTQPLAQMSTRHLPAGVISA